MRRSLSLKDDDYRLSFLYGNFTTLTRFTEMDLERVLTERPQPAVRVHPRHRPRRPGRAAAQPARRDQPAVAGGAARRGHRGPRPGGGVPGQERRRRPGGHPGRRARPLPVAGHRGLRAPRGQPLLPRERHAAPHPGRGRRRLRHRGAVAGDLPRRPRAADGLRRRRVLPDGRAALSRPRPPTRAFPSTRTAWAWPGPSRPPSAATSGPPSGCAPGFFAAVDGAPAAGYRARAASPVGRADVGRGAPIAILTGEYGARVLGPLVDALGRDDIRLVPVANPSSAATSASPAC